MKYLYTLLLALCVVNSFAQKQGNQWYFGIYAGLDFNSGTPVPILTSAMSTFEGCASIADRNTGNLLFYTDGTSVWDSTNTIMPNGSGLGGDYSTTQSAVIVPRPGSNSLYYIFTLASDAGGGLNVNVVDMSLHGGLGDVTTTKDSLLVTPATEKCGTYFSCNGDSVWVVVHQWNTDAFYAYLVTANGISAPVISHSGIVINNQSGQDAEAIGYMRISNDGKKLGMDCEYKLNTMQLSDFNSFTGVVSNSIADTAFPGSSGPYGLCFSPGNSKMYVTFNGNSGSDIYQYNMLAGNNSAIIASRTSVAPVGGGAIQQGPDGKLYVVSGNQNYLGVITNPEVLGSACNFIPNKVSLGGKQCFLGLPDIIPNYSTVALVQSKSTVICTGQSTLLIASGGSSYSWSPAAGLSSTTGDSVIANPTITTVYSVTSTNSHGCTTIGTDTVTVKSVLSLAVQPQNPSVCEGQSITLSVPASGTDYLWSPSATLNTSTGYVVIATPTVTITYTVTGTDSLGCSALASDTVSVLPAPNKPTIAVSVTGDSLISSATQGNQWYFNDTLINGATNQVLVILGHQKGNYKVNVINPANGCSATSDSTTSINLLFAENSKISIYPNPTTGQFTIKIPTGQTNYLVEIYNVLGVKIYQSILSNYQNTINLTSQPDGMYFVYLKSDEGIEVGKVLLSK